MRAWRSALFGALLLAGATAAAEVNIQAMCNVTGMGSQCTFSNTGSDRGSGCATVVLTNRTTQQQIRSGVVCSGEMSPTSTGASVPIQFVGNLITHCGAPLPGGIAGNCEMRVEMSNLQVTGANAIGALCGGLMWLLVIASAIWVYADAKRRAFQNAGTLAAGTLFLWIIVLPWYLLTRDKRSREQAAASPPQWGGGYPPQGGGYPPQGGGYPPQGGGGYPPR